MKLGARSITVMAVGLWMAPALFADATAKPARHPKKDASASPTASSAAPAKAQPPGRPKSSPTPGPVRKAAAGGAWGMHHPDRDEDSDNGLPKVELFMGYTYWAALPKSIHNRIDGMHGGTTSLTFNVKSHLGFVVEFGGFRVKCPLPKQKSLSEQYAADHRSHFPLWRRPCDIGASRQYQSDDDVLVG